MFLPPELPERKPPTKTETSMVLPAERQEEYTELMASLHLSEKVHILGFTREARFITHCLAGTPELVPPQLLVQHRRVMDKWGEEGRQVTLKAKQGPRISHDTLMPYYIGDTRRAGQHTSYRPRIKHIDNLIVSTAESAILPTLLSIRDSLDHDSTVCLIHAGLGVVEHLNQTIFRDAATRPTFILGHMSHGITRDPQHQDSLYSIQLQHEGRLFLTGISAEVTDGEIATRPWDRIANRARVQHMVKLLSAVPGLNAVGVPMHKFLRQKLPSMISSSLADSISVATGFRYDRLHADQDARSLWYTLFRETVDIVTALPELQKHPDMINYFKGRNFENELMRWLKAQHGASPWIAMVRSGKSLPIHYLNGYFRRRAKEMGISGSAHHMIMSMVNSRQRARREELKADLPLYYAPKYMDGDMIQDDEERTSRVTLAYVK